MADEQRKSALFVHDIEAGGEFTEDRAIINFRFAQGTVPVVFTVPQLRQLLPQLSGLLGKLRGDSSVVWKASTSRIGRTLDGDLRFDFPLLDGATVSVAIPMACAAQVRDHIRAEAAKKSDPPPERRRH